MNATESDESMWDVAARIMWVIGASFGHDEGAIIVAFVWKLSTEVEYVFQVEMAKHSTGGAGHVR